MTDKTTPTITHGLQVVFIDTKHNIKHKVSLLKDENDRFAIDFIVWFDGEGEEPNHSRVRMEKEPFHEIVKMFSKFSLNLDECKIEEKP